MATGDIKNNLRKLKTELKKVSYPDDLDLEQIIIGMSGPFLPILHHLFVDYSVELSTYFSSKGYDFYGKNDLRFLEVIYRILITEFGMKPMLTKAQFFAIGYAEVKIIFVTKIVVLCWKKNQELLNKLRKKKTLKSSIGKSEINQKNVRNHSKLNTENCVSIDKIGVGIKETKQPFVEKHFSQPPLSIPPLPTLDLTLTPEKVNFINQNFMQKDVGLACSLLDVTEIEDDIDQSNVEFENTVSDGKDFPKFVMTRHNDDSLRGYTSVTNEDTIATAKGNYEFSSSVNNQLYDVELANMDSPFLTHNAIEQQSRNLEHHLNNKQKGLTNANQDCRQCSQCQTNSEELLRLQDQFSIMTKQFQDIISINNDLSAKLILMDTRVIFMENVIKKQNTTNESYRYDEEVKPPAQNIAMPSSNEVRKTSPTVTEKRQEYSPVKYTDDDVIIRDFKPLRMNDVRKLLKGTKNQNKENYVYRQQVETEFLDQKNDTNMRDSIHFDVAHRGVLEDSMISTSLNVSNIFGNDNTKQIVRDVKKRLLDTEQLLKKSASNLIK